MGTVIFFIVACTLLTIIFIFLLYKERQRTADALRDREAVLDNISTAFIYLDKDFRVQWRSNHAVGVIMSRVERYEKDKLCYRTVKGLDHPCPNCPIHKMLENGEPVDLMDTDDGYSVHIKFFPVRNNRNAIIGSVLQLQDVTKEREQEQQLIRMKERFQFSLFGANLFSWEMDINTKEITGVVKNNPSQHFKLDAYILTYIHPDYHEMIWEELNEMFEHKKDHFEVYVKAQTALNGMTRYEWMHITGKAMIPDKDGKNTKIFGIQRIVTEEKQQQIDLEEAYSQLQLMFEASHVSPWTYDFATGQFASTNPNVVEASGIKTDALLVYIHPEDQEKFQTAMRETYSGEKKSLYLQLRCTLPEDKGQENWYEISGIVFQYDNTGVPLRMIGIRRNIMYLKHTDELIELRNRAEASNKMKDTFLANMSHEIRTPLNAIVGFSQIIMEASDNKEQLVDYYKVVESNSELLLQLINDILDLSRIEAGQIEMSFADFDICSIFDTLYKVYNIKVNKEVELQLTLPEKSCRIHSDRKRLTQVVSNFLSNACKYTEKGSITMGYSYTDSGLRFFVSDTGKGMAEENLPAVFDRFTKFDSFIQGVGLGLSICKSIVENLGGEIGVISSLSKGSEFWFTLPCDYELTDKKTVTTDA